MLLEKKNAVILPSVPSAFASTACANVLRRPLRVDETATTVAWVASDFASGVAGQVVNVCAGAIVSR